MIHIGRFKRNSATIAAAWSEPINLLPAVRAKLMRRIGNCPASGTARRKCEIERVATEPLNSLHHRIHPPLVAARAPAHKGQVSAPIFDLSLRQLRRDRAAKIGGDRFLHDRAFDDCLDRLIDIRVPVATILIAGPSDDRWVAELTAALPGAIITAGKDDLSQLEPASFNLCLSIGELHTSNDLTTDAFVLRQLLAPGGLLLGAVVGGNSLPRLRSAMLAADRAAGGAAPRIHPTIDGPSLSALLGSVGLVEPVVDVDRLSVSYASLDRLVADLRAAACTNILARQSRQPSNRRHFAASRAAFLNGEERAVEHFELLHFTAWAPRS